MSVCRKGRYLHNTKQIKDTRIHVLSGFRNRDLSNQSTPDRTAAVVGLSFARYVGYFFLKNLPI